MMLNLLILNIMYHLYDCKSTITRLVCGKSSVFEILEKAWKIFPECQFQPLEREIQHKEGFLLLLDFILSIICGKGKSMVTMLS